MKGDDKKLKVNRPEINVHFAFIVHGDIINALI